MAKKVAYWTTTVIVAALSLIAARSYLSGAAHAEFARLGPRIPSTIAYHSWHRQTAWCDYASDPRRTQTQGVGLRGVHLRLDLCLCCPLSCQGRSNRVHAAGSASDSGRFLLDPPSWQGLRSQYRMQAG
jgi:hypothetical protein